MGSIEIHCRIGGWYYRHDFVLIGSYYVHHKSSWHTLHYRSMFSLMSTFSFVLKSTSEIANPMSKFECKQKWQKTLATKVVRRPAAAMQKSGSLYQWRTQSWLWVKPTHWKFELFVIVCLHKITAPIHFIIHFSRKTLTIVQIFHICFSFWGTSCPPYLLPGLCPWTPLGDLHPSDPLAWSLLGNTWIHSEPLYYKILGLPMACAHAELENVLRLIKERQLNFWSRPRMMLPEIASNKRLVGAIGSHSGFTVVIHNNGRNVFLWRPVNYTLPIHYSCKLNVTLIGVKYW